MQIRIHRSRYNDKIYALCTRVFSLCTATMYGAAGTPNDDVQLVYGAAANAMIMNALCTRGFVLRAALCTGTGCIMNGAAGPRRDI